LSYSGGKDSHFLLWFIKNILKNDRIEIVSVNTLLEHPEIAKRIREHADKILLPAKKHSDIKKERGIPCFSKFQDDYIKRYQKGSRSPNTMRIIDGSYSKWFRLNKKAKELLLANKLHKISSDCCLFLKKKPLGIFEKESGKKPIMGVRGSEGIMRKNNYKSCFTKKKYFTPLFDLTDQMLDKINAKYKILVPEVYDTLERTGCMGCPYGRHVEKELSLLNEAQRKFITDYFKESYEIKGIKY
jgi:3'-phosphoadenosine 5'-phosphosulfate sulfotransferase (PAPS reductase)/FAD synthetase